mmetsp:Transcript_29833/g.67612  ORF Transcript_29833/g.67612 Transcript_29833/m.67612 type:complete len:221 (-) Transcript_29833:565-1227(-)
MSRRLRLARPSPLALLRSCRASCPGSSWCCLRRAARLLGLPLRGFLGELLRVFAHEPRSPAISGIRMRAQSLGGSLAPFQRHPPRGHLEGTCNVLRLALRDPGARVLDVEGGLVIPLLVRRRHLDQGAVDDGDAPSGAWDVLGPCRAVLRQPGKEVGYVIAGGHVEELVLLGPVVVAGVQRRRQRALAVFTVLVWLLLLEHVSGDLAPLHEEENDQQRPA